MTDAMDFRRTLRKTKRGLGLWIVVVIGTLLVGVGDTLLQMYIIDHDITGALSMVHYLFFVYSPFVISGVCGVLFVPLVAYPVRGLLLARGATRTWSTIICGSVGVAGSVIAYWIVLASWVALRAMLARIE